MVGAFRDISRIVPMPTSTATGRVEHLENPPMNAPIEPPQGLADFWSMPQEDLLRHLRSTAQGLSDEDARRRLASGPTHSIGEGRWPRVLSLLAAQFKGPIILILIAAAGLSLVLGQVTDASIILAIVLASGLLGFRQEWGAADAL
jgi:Mg2+-importing ATPase